jgi:REP element-mobilizing transposase RayT
MCSFRAGPKGPASPTSVSKTHAHIESRGIPMVLAYHVVCGCYGLWLPNDPRGSGSDYIRNPSLLPYGHATRVAERRRSRASLTHDRELRQEAKQALRHPPVVFNGHQAQCIGTAFAEFAAKANLVIHACAIMPDHVHVVVARHRYSIEQAVNLLKGAATRRLVAHSIHPFAPDAEGVRPSIWAAGLGWKVFLNTPDEIRGRIRYVEENPVKARLPAQKWKFVQPYEPKA